MKKKKEIEAFGFFLAASLAKTLTKIIYCVASPREKQVFAKNLFTSAPTDTLQREHLFSAKTFVSFLTQTNRRGHVKWEGDFG